MPTIEIICLEQQTPLELPELSFALRSENEPISHRSLFYDEFKHLKGCIYHLGNPNQRNEDDWLFADQLVYWHLDQEGLLKFLPQFLPEIQRLLTALLDASPIHTITFSSDYQFGPKVKRYQRPLTCERFWQKHEAQKLWLNARYFISP